MSISETNHPLFDSRGIPKGESGPPASSLRDWEEWTVVSREECATYRELNWQNTNYMTGEVTSRKSVIAEVGNGLNYLDGSTGKPEWRESLDLIEQQPSGVAAALNLGPPFNAYAGWYGFDLIKLHSAMAMLAYWAGLPTPYPTATTYSLNGFPNTN